MRMSGGHSKVNSTSLRRDILSVAITAFIFISVILRIIVKKLFKIFSKVLCATISASFCRFYHTIALLFSSKNGKNLHKSVSQIF